MDITARYLREGAAHYRGAAVTAKSPAAAKRSREYAEILEEQAERFARMAAENRLAETTRPKAVAVPDDAERAGHRGF